VLGELIVHFSECLTTDEQDKVNWMRVDGTDKLSMDRDQLPRPLLVFDGDCSFCRAWVEYWKDSTGNRVDYSPFQEVGEFPHVSHQQFTSAVKLILPDGEVRNGAHAG
jgi:hypothetical protein